MKSKKLNFTLNSSKAELDISIDQQPTAFFNVFDVFNVSHNTHIQINSDKRILIKCNKPEEIMKCAKALIEHIKKIHEFPNESDIVNLKNNIEELKNKKLELQQSRKNLVTNNPIYEVINIFTNDKINNIDKEIGLVITEKLTICEALSEKNKDNIHAKIKEASEKLKNNTEIISGIENTIKQLENKKPYNLCKSEMGFNKILAHSEQNERITYQRELLKIQSALSDELNKDINTQKNELQSIENSELRLAKITEQEKILYDIKVTGLELQKAEEKLEELQKHLLLKEITPEKLAQSILFHAFKDMKNQTLRTHESNWCNFFRGICQDNAVETQNAIALLIKSKSDKSIAFYSQLKEINCVHKFILNAYNFILGWLLGKSVTLQDNEIARWTQKIAVNKFSATLDLKTDVLTVELDPNKKGDFVQNSIHNASFLYKKESCSRNI